MDLFMHEFSTLQANSYRTVIEFRPKSNWQWTIWKTWSFHVWSIKHVDKTDSKKDKKKEEYRINEKKYQEIGAT